MKQLIRWMLIVSMLLSICGCARRRTDISLEEIVAAYDAAGYDVSSGLYDETLEHAQIGYVQADHPDRDYIYFAIFENATQGPRIQVSKTTLFHPGSLGLSSKG